MASEREWKVRVNQEPPRYVLAVNMAAAALEVWTASGKPSGEVRVTSEGGKRRTSKVYNPNGSGGLRERWL